MNADALTFDFAISAKAVIRSLVRSRFRETWACFPNFTPRKWWECDVFEITKAGYFCEYEVKVSRSDFFADAKKEQEVFPRSFGQPKVFEKKHDLLAAGSERGPSRFFYVTPEGLIQPHEVPVWAGLIEVRDCLFIESMRGELRQFATMREREVTPAPRLHRVKCADEIRRDVMRNGYWRYLDLFTK